MAYKKLFEKICTQLYSNGFTCERNISFTEFNLNTELFATQKGKTLGILPFCDYIFAYAGKYFSNSTEIVNEMHQKARNYVDTLYKWPKAFRLSVPNIASLIISFDGFSEEQKILAQKKTRTFVGGEIHGFYFVDMENLDFICQELSSVTVSGAIPQSRMFYLLNPIVEGLFKDKQDYVG